MNRTEIINEYFELQTWLNKSNRAKDQKTEIYFELSETQLFVTLKPDQDVKFCLCEKLDDRHRWMTTQHHRFTGLGGKIKEFLNENNFNSNEFDQNLKLFLFSEHL